MTQQQDAKIAGEMKEVLAQDRDFLRPLVQGGAGAVRGGDGPVPGGRYERTGARWGHRSGY